MQSETRGIKYKPYYIPTNHISLERVRFEQFKYVIISVVGGSHTKLWHKVFVCCNRSVRTPIAA